jgi:hypothetical protein
MARRADAERNKYFSQLTSSVHRRLRVLDGGRGHGKKAGGAAAQVEGRVVWVVLYARTKNLI